MQGDINCACWRSIGDEWEYGWNYDNGIRRNELDDYEALLPKNLVFAITLMTRPS